MTPEVQKPLRIFCSYSRRGEEHLNDLKVSLRDLERQGLIEWWHDREIVPGSEREEDIVQSFETADIIILLVSADFKASDYDVYEREIGRAVERHERGEALVIPIIVHWVRWGRTPFANLKALPKGAKPVTDWLNPDDAWYSVAEGVEKAVQELTSKRGVDERKDLTDSQVDDEPIPEDTKIQLFNELREAGLKAIYDGVAKRHLDIIGPKFYESTKTVQILDSWTGYREVGITRDIRKAVERGCKVQILLVNPNSVQAEYRARALHLFDERYTEDSVRAGIRDDLEALVELRRDLSQKDEYKDAIQIRVYDAATVLEMYRFDDTRIVGLQLHGAEAVRGPQFEVVNDARSGSQSTFLARRVDEHFEALWNDERTLDASEVTKET